MAKRRSGQGFGEAPVRQVGRPRRRAKAWLRLSSCYGDTVRVYDNAHDPVSNQDNYSMGLCSAELYPLLSPSARRRLELGEVVRVYSVETD